MKYVIALVALVGLLGFSGFVRAADTPAKTPKPHPGHFVKLDGSKLVYIGGAAGKGKEHTVATDDKTKVTLDDKEAKLADLKEGVYIEVTIVDKVATIVAASTTPPAKPEKPAKPAASDKPAK
ncbi:MAG TPA: hypothetical protein VG269_11680 [Tepidisphaeraceae bacterium]|jgi:hypothetical protein|nr:hypothetical protein [Tepidisphaeraceae bacterium]